MRLHFHIKFHLLFCHFYLGLGFLLPVQAPSQNSNDCICGLTCMVPTDRCRPCLGPTCSAALQQGYPVAGYPPYKPQPLLRLTQLYDLMTPPSPMTVSLPSPPHLSRSAELPVLRNNTSIKWSQRQQQLPVYVQVPPSSTVTENNGRADSNQLFFEQSDGSVSTLHSADVTPRPRPLRNSSTSLLFDQSTTASTIPEEQNQHYIPTTVTSSIDQVSLEPDLNYGGTTTDGESATTTVTSTPSPLDELLDPFSSNGADLEGGSGAEDDTLKNPTVQHFSDYESLHLNVLDSTTPAAEKTPVLETKHVLDYSPLVFNALDTSTFTTTAEPTNSSIPSVPPITVETTHIEVYHPKDEQIIGSDYEIVTNSLPTSTPAGLFTDIETTVYRDSVKLPGYLPTEIDESSPLLPISEDSVNSYHATPRSKFISEISKVFSGYEASKGQTSSVPPSSSSSGFSSQRPTIITHYKQKRKFKRKHRESGTVGKFYDTRATRSELKAHVRPKCNSTKLRKILEDKMSLSTTVSKQMVFSAARTSYPGRSVNVICSRHSFSYIVVTSPVYCEHRKAHLTCFAFLQP